MVITKTKILKTLKKLDKLYNAVNKKVEYDLPNYYSKLALLELCGWVEQSMDDILRCFQRKLKEEKNINYLETRIIKPTHSFEYHTHFREMLIKTIGITGVEKMERKINNRKKEILASSLGILKTMRDEHAHTYISGTTHRLHAPSISESHFRKIYDGLKEFEKAI